MKKFCLVGENVVGISLSKVIHEAFGKYEYELKNLSAEMLPSFLKTSPYDGFNVTMPFKKAVIPYLDFLSSTASLTGSVNTVKKENGKLIGFNTDILGMEYAFSKENARLFGKYCLILGSGGTSDTAAAFCKKCGAKKVEKVSRKGELNYENVYEKSPDVIINATPVGMFPNVSESPIDIRKFKSVEILFDAIYNPKETLLVKTAKEQNVKAVGGLDMLIAQAKYAGEIFTGDILPDECFALARIAVEKYERSLS